MKTFNKRIKELLSSECLTQQEKEYLKLVFKQFVNNRSIISRKKVEYNNEDKCWELDGITR